MWNWWSAHDKEYTPMVITIYKKNSEYTSAHWPTISFVKLNDFYTISIASILLCIYQCEIIYAAYQSTQCTSRKKAAAMTFLWLSRFHDGKKWLGMSWFLVNWGGQKRMKKKIQNCLNRLHKWNKLNKYTFEATQTPATTVTTTAVVVAVAVMPSAAMPNRSVLTSKLRRCTNPMKSNQNSNLSAKNIEYIFIANASLVIVWLASSVNTVPTRCYVAEKRAKKKNVRRNTAREKNNSRLYNKNRESSE